MEQLGLPGCEANAVDIWSGAKGVVRDKESVDLAPHTVECYAIEVPQEITCEPDTVIL